MCVGRWLPVDSLSFLRLPEHLFSVAWGCHGPSYAPVTDTRVQQRESEIKGASVPA